MKYLGVILLGLSLASALCSVHATICNYTGWFIVMSVVSGACLATGLTVILLYDH